MAQRERPLPPSACLLACVLEVEVAGGRDPNSFVASLSDALEADDGQGALGSALVEQQPTPRGRRAVAALVETLKGKYDGGEERQPSSSHPDAHSAASQASVEWV